MGWAKFRAGFVGDDSNEWSVSASDSFLKSHEETNFVVRYTPNNPGVSNAYFIIETEVRQMILDLISLYLLSCLNSGVYFHRRTSPRRGRLLVALENMRSPTICEYRGALSCHANLVRKLFCSFTINADSLEIVLKNASC
jgi:hypothetical protein